MAGVVPRSILLHVTVTVPVVGFTLFSPFVTTVPVRASSVHAVYVKSDKYENYLECRVHSKTI